MKTKNLQPNKTIKKAICLVLLLSVALLSIFVVSKPATSPKNYRATIESIDEKKATVMGITATAAAVSTALALIPSDATTPVANQIMEISSYLLIVVCVLVLEKSLLTALGYLSFNILIPIACGLLGFYVFIKKETIKILAIKLIVFALVLVMIIPVSLKISDLIYDINKTTIEQVTAEIDDSIKEKDEDKSWLEKTLDKLKDSVSNVGEKTKQILNRFIDAIAIFIIAYCAIPVIVVLLMFWFVKFLFGITVPMPRSNKIPFSRKEKNEEETAISTEVNS